MQGDSVAAVDDIKRERCRDDFAAEGNLTVTAAKHVVEAEQCVLVVTGHRQVDFITSPFVESFVWAVAAEESVNRADVAIDALMEGRRDQVAV